MGSLKKRLLEGDFKGIIDTPAFKDALLLALFMALTTFLFFAFFYGPSPLNGADNYAYVADARIAASGGFDSMPGPFGVKYILIGGIALFYKLFGLSRLSGALFELLTVYGTILCTYLIGKKLYDRRAGLLAAFLFSFFPPVIIEASNMSDGGALTLFATIAITLVVFGFKGRNKRYYALSGFIVTIGFMVDAEEIIALLPVLLCVLALEAHDRKGALFHTLFGAAIGVLVICMLSYALFSNPMYILSIDNTWYTAQGLGGTPQFVHTLVNTFNVYLDIMFPHLRSTSSAAQCCTINQFGSFVKYTGTLVYTGLSQSGAYYQADAFGSSIVKTGVGDAYYFAFYPFFMVVAAAFLILTRDKRIIVPGIWALSSFLYLSGGSMGIMRYALIVPAYPRYLNIFAPAMSVIIAFGVIKVFDVVRRYGNRNKLALLGTRFDNTMIPGIITLVVVVGVLMPISVYIIAYTNYSIYNQQYSQISIASILDGLHGNITVAFPYGINIAPVYFGHYYNTSNLDYTGTCPGSSFYGDYLISNKLIPKSCGVIEIATPESPKWLASYPNTMCCVDYGFQNSTLYYLPKPTDMAT